MQKEIYAPRGAAAGDKRSVELARAQFADKILDHANTCIWPTGRAGPTVRYTTRAVLEAEAHVLRAAEGLTSDRAHGLTDRQRSRVLNSDRYDGITREQARAFRHATGAEGLAIIDGQAGTGKSFTIAAVREAYEASRTPRDRPRWTDQRGRRTWRTRTASATPAPSKASCSCSTTAAQQWDSKTVVIVDEAAMLDTKLMAMVTRHAHDAGAKLILVGDDRQLSSIDAAACSASLKDRHGAAELSRGQRQHKQRRAARERE